MKMHQADANRHLRDADLMRLVDGEESPLERTRNAAHLSACARCAAEVQRLRADVAIVRGWLDRAEFEAALPAHASAAPRVDDASPAARRASSRSAARMPVAWLKAAAVLLFVAAPVAAIPSLRERVIGAFTDAPVASGPAAVTATAAAHQPAATTVRFEPAAGTFMVRIDSRQTDGVLRVEHGTGDHAVLSMVGVTGEGPVVSATVLHIRNDASAAAGYRLQVPQGVTAVTVSIAGRIVATLDEAALAGGAELSIR